MKKSLLFSLLLFFLVKNSNAQEPSTGKSKNSFIEWNFGLAYVTLMSPDSFLFPGTSVLWGQTHINEDNFVFEYEVGFALPSIVTAKLGIGKKFNNTKVTIGVRPFPFNLFLQSSFKSGKKGYWMTSIEFNPLNSDIGLSLYSKANFNFGYRWDITSNK